MCWISSSLDYIKLIILFALHCCVTIVCAQHRDHDRINDPKGKYSGVFPVFVSFYFVLWMILLSLSSCWSRRAALSRTTPRTSCSCQITRTTRTTASALSAELDWTTPHKRSCPGMVLERASLHSFEWVLVSCKSKLTMDSSDDASSSTLNLEPCQLPLHGAKLPESTADGEPEPATVVETSPSGVTELTITSEREPQVSD